ncbi:UNVERIFIED_CONTAM: Tubby-like F-box protein 3 [Sesamum latifolium]|uniref:Tubby-like F-box protein 3 n=1 Tax=Sesamum latifolium TaxID=2727402 RepID=A0AAW2XW42_9LAMI
MKGEFGSISRKGFEGRFGYGMRSRSHRVVEDCSVTVVDALRQSCWANMPSELLRDVLMRIEESECSWPQRKNVVACAGVCRSWREIMKEIVRNLEVSGKMTFPISLKQPGPRDTLIQCFIKRNRGNQTYHLYLNLSQASNDDGKFLLAARRCRRPTYTDYIISLNADDVSKGSNNYIGKLRSNFLGTKFTIYDAQPPNAGAKVTKSRSTRIVGMRQVSPKVPAGNYPVAHISYELNVLVQVASVKNFQLVASLENGAGGQEQENVILQFGKVGKDIFTMDYQYPISAFQAFAICLSSFDTKIACE